jgi:hypothetical protein
MPLVVRHFISAGCGIRSNGDGRSAVGSTIFSPVFRFAPKQEMLIAVLSLAGSQPAARLSGMPLETRKFRQVVIENTLRSCQLFMGLQP